jgi:signal transduction histidine kinase/DNA-binding response OmpR family regulator/ligand-binding sensor domain-containing protein
MKTIYILFLLLFISDPTSGQYFKNLNVYDGLPNSTVKCFAMDKQGFIWMGTFNGLTRFQGFNFSNYHHKDWDPESLAGNHIESLLATKDGLYIGTNAGLDFFSFKNQVFQHCFYVSGISKIMRLGASILILSNSGNVWQKKNAETSFRYMSGKRWRAITPYGKHHILILTDKKLILADIHLKPLSRISVSNLPTSGNVLYYSKNLNRILIGSGIGYPGRCYKVDACHRLHTATLRIPSDIKAITDYNGQTFFGTDGKGLIAFNKKGVQTYTPNNSNISSYAIHSLFADRKGNLWIGTYRDGINIMSTHFNIFHSLSTQERQISYNVVTAISAKRNQIILGLDGGGLNIYDSHTHKSRVYTTKNSTLPGNHILSVTEDRNYLWLGIYEKGICRYSLTDGSCRIYRIIPFHGVPRLDVLWNIKDDQRGHLIIKGDRMMVLDKTSGKLSYIKSMENRQCSSMCISKGQIYVSTDDGLYQLNEYTFRIKRRYRHKLLNKASCICIYRDQIWISKGYQGLYALNLKTLHIKVFHQEDGLPANNITSMQGDNQGNLWLGSDEGLYVYRPLYHNFIKYGKEDNLSQTEFCSGACYRNGNKLYFGTTKGLIYFNSKDINLDHTDHRVYFNSLNILKNNKTIPLYGSFPNPLKVAHDQNFFILHFSVPEMITPYKIKFMYKLKGFDKQWRILEETRQVSYTNVPPGKYSFLIKASKSDGKWSNKISELSIQVAEPWWNTTLADFFWILSGIGVIYIIFAFYAYRQRIKNELLQKEYEKEIEKKANDDKLNFFANITHELRTPMFLITAPLEELLASTQRPVPVPHSYLKDMYRNALRLNKLINHILDFRKLESGDMELKIRNLDIIAFCRHLTVDYTALFQQKNISFHFCSSKDSLFADFDAEKLELILSNLISNAYKYTGNGGNVTLSIKDLDDDVEICLADTGAGIDPKDINKIFDKYYRVNATSKITGNGLGLAFVKQLVELHGGIIRVSSKPNQGSKFIFTIPRSQPKNGQCALDGTLEKHIQEEKADDLPASKVNLQSPTSTQIILIVDDEQETADMLTRYLAKNYRILTAYDGEKGLDIAASQFPDLIICDIMMPKMNGYEFLSHIKADKKLEHIPIIMFSAKILDDDKIKAFNYGADAYLTKPISLKYLKARIESLLSKSHSTLYTSNLKTGIQERTSHYSKDDQLFILKCKEIIDKNMTNENLGADFLAEQLHMSHSSLYKKVKTITGDSIINLIMSPL